MCCFLLVSFLQNLTEICTYSTTATACTSNLVPVGGGGDRHNQYKGSRIPPGVRPWLSRRLEELWGIDGQVYSHYILSVLLDGVDNEFFVDDSELQDLNRSRKGTKKGANDTREAASGEADSFEARRRAVLNYLSSFSVDEVTCLCIVHEGIYVYVFVEPLEHRGRLFNGCVEILRCGCIFECNPSLNNSR